MTHFGEEDRRRLRGSQHRVWSMKQGTYSTDAGTRAGNEDGLAQKASGAEDGHGAVSGEAKGWDVAGPRSQRKGPEWKGDGGPPEQQGRHGHYIVFPNPRQINLIMNDRVRT